MGQFNTIPPNGFPAIPYIENIEGIEKDVSTLKTTTAGLAEDVDDLKSGLIAVDKIVQYIFNAQTMTDFDDLATDKAMTIYQIGTAINMANKPSSGTFGLLVVYRVASYYIQVWLPADGNIMHRAKTTNSWGAWS